MLLSMTGFGSATRRSQGLTIEVDVRSVNNRHLKVSVRGTDPYPLYESEIEKVIRRTVRRGSVSVYVRVERPYPVTGSAINTEALTAYIHQIRRACEAAGCPEYAGPLMTAALTLPGVMPEPRHLGSPPDEEWPLVRATLESALEKLDAMRAEEGRATSAELMELHAAIRKELAGVRSLLPTITTGYRQRLLDRVNSALAEAGVSLQPEHLIREVALFADRTDVSEEVTRLTSHLEQFVAIVKEGTEAGRRLEFLVQEMGREANTLGSKAGDIGISRHVLEIKATLEKIRELVQNIE